MKKEKLHFFKKLFLVITDFRTYPFLVKHERFYKSISYLITLTLIISLIFTMNIVLKLNNTLETIIENYDDLVPEFELSNDVLDVSKKYNEKITNESFLVIDTDYTYDEYKKTEEYAALVKYDTIMLVNSDKITIESVESYYSILYEELGYDINKTMLYDEILSQFGGIGYVAYIIAIFISVFTGYLIAVLIKVLFLACIISIICSLTGVRLNFRNYIKIAIYAYTLPLIIELISYCLVGTIKDYAYYTNLLLTYVYIIYAIRAIRLDAFIMMFSKKNNGKHHTVTEFEKELEKYNELMNNEIKNNDDDETNKKDNENKEE